MKRYNLKARYFFSCVIDYGIMFAVIVPFSKLNDQMNDTLFGISMLLIELIIFTQDRYLNGASIGKRILGIKMISNEGFKEITWGETTTRRFLEMLYTYKIIIWRLYINIDKISNSKIVHKSCDVRQKESKKVVLLAGNHTLNIKREKAFFIDLLIISFAIISSYIIRLNYFKNLINNYNDNLYFWLNYSLSFSIALYFTFRDFIHRNASIGKKKLGICVVDKEGNKPSGLQMFVRGSIQMGLWPIEIILFLLNKRQIAEMLTYTKVIEDKR